jgi:hypothetical protein
MQPAVNAIIDEMQDALYSLPDVNDADKYLKYQGQYMAGWNILNKLPIDRELLKRMVLNALIESQTQRNKDYVNFLIEGVGNGNARTESTVDRDSSESIGN